MNIADYSQQSVIRFNRFTIIATILNKTGTVILGIEPAGISCVYVAKYGFKGRCGRNARFLMNSKGKINTQ